LSVDCDALGLDTRHAAQDEDGTVKNSEGPLHLRGRDRGREGASERGKV